MNAKLCLIFATLMSVIFSSGLFAQCPDTLIVNGGFEQGLTNWWTWHGGDMDAYSFELSDDAFMGDSSAVLNVLEDTDSISGGAGEYNNRPDSISITGGSFYEITFAAKSTVDSTEVRVNVKDEFDSWFTVTNQVVTVGTTWAMYTVSFQADMDRNDVHMEFQVFNADFHSPYSVFLDEIVLCKSDINTNTCADNLVNNAGYEAGAFTDWWTWHGGEETDYAFATSSESYLGDSSAMISVLKSSDMVVGPGEFNSRPVTTSAIVDSQNYKITLWGKSTLENTEIQVWIKDEFDGWTTVHNENLIVGTDWTEVSTVFTADMDRADVHVELKVFNAGFTAPYDVWLDEVSICTTEETPGGGGGDGGPVFDYGSTEAVTDCSNNLAPGNDGFEAPSDTAGWDIWDGSDTEELATITVDPVLPYSGTNSARIDVAEGNNTAEFHHRFGDRFTVEDGKEYAMTMWIRSDVPAGDSVDILARVVRDTDWEAQVNGNFTVVSNGWLNFSERFTADGTWTNAFVELKATRRNETTFSGAYSIWYDDIEVCSVDSATFTSITDLEDLGLSFNLFPNPTSGAAIATLNIVSEEYLKDAQIDIVDMLGRKVWNKQTHIVPGSQDISLPAHAWGAGLYMVHIEHNGYVKNLKLQVLK